MLSIWIMTAHERALTKEVFYFIVYVFRGPSRIPSRDTLCYFTMGKNMD